MNPFPPGLAGYIAAQRHQGQQEAHQASLLGSLVGLQGQMAQQQAMQRQLAEAQQRQGLLERFASQLPEADRAAFLVDPKGYMKARAEGFTLSPGQTRYRGDQQIAAAPEAPYTMSPGQTRMRGDQQIASLPANPTLHNIPVPGQPGVEQPTWLRPGETQGAAVGGLRAPAILNPAVQAARQNVARAGASRTNVTVNPMRETFKDEQSLRKEYTDASGSFVKLAEGYAKVKGALASDPSTSSPASMAAATQFMKMLDPDSVVRESELGMALNAAGVWDRFMNIHNTIKSGKVLTPTQAKEFGRIADVVYGAANRAQQGRVQHFQGLAQSYNFDPARVVPDLTPRQGVPLRRATDSNDPLGIRK